MANVEIVAGISTYLLYGAESTFGTAVTVNVNFGGLIQEMSPELNRNLIEHRGVVASNYDGMEVAVQTDGMVEGRVPTIIRPVVWDWLQYAFGSRTGSGTGGSPYLYTADSSPTSLTIGVNDNFATTDRERLLLGCIAERISIAFATGEPVEVTIDWVYADEDKDSTLTSNQNITSGNPYTYLGGTFELPNASALGNIIEDGTIEISWDVQMHAGINVTTANIARGATRSNMQIRVNWTQKAITDTVLEDVLGGSSGVTTTTVSATMGIKFTNGSTKHIDFQFGNTQINLFTERHRIGETLVEEAEAWPISLTIEERQTS